MCSHLVSYLRDFQAELSRVNHIISSTIKALIVTLPEPSSMDRGLRTGVTGGVLLSARDFIEGSGAKDGGLASWIADLIESLAG